MEVRRNRNANFIVFSVHHLLWRILRIGERRLQHVPDVVLAMNQVASLRIAAARRGWAASRCPSRRTGRRQQGRSARRIGDIRPRWCDDRVQIGADRTDAGRRLRVRVQWSTRIRYPCTRNQNNQQKLTWVEWKSIWKIEKKSV